MAPPEPPTVALRRLVNGYQVTQAIHVAATLGIADLLRDGPLSSDELAAATSTHAESLRRVLRALASVGVLHEDGDDRFALTEIGACLRSDAPDPVGGWAAFAGRPYHFAAWSNLLHGVRTGENPFRAVHGADVWEYRAAHADEGAVFDRAMTDLTRRANRHLLEAYDFSALGSIVDVGGGHGALVAALLAAYPRLRAVLFDLPHVVADAPALLESAGVAARCDVVGGSFFDDPLPAGADASLLKAVLHDWEDDDALRIVRACRAAAGPDALALVVDRDRGGPNEDPEAKLSDLNMLVGTGGRERTRDELATLLAEGGFALQRAIPTGISSLSVFEARAADP
jgi:SAM-dependent methyltransferase